MVKRYLWLFFFFFCCSQASFAASYHDKIQKILDDFRIQSQVPGAALSINFSENKILNFVTGRIRIASVKDKFPPLVTPDNLFQIGSITKSFTAAIVLQLEAEGKFSINDTIADIGKKYGRWLPEKEYQAWQSISIKQLLNMTSGIFSVTEDKDFLSILAKHPKKTWTSKEIIHYAYLHNAYFAPGKGWHYSDTNYYILEILIEFITKHSFAYEMDHRILKKYGLNNTFYLIEEYPENIKRRMAHGYAYTGGEFSPPIKSGTDTTFANMSAASAAGALVSNSIDITRWVRLLFTGKVLPMAQLKEMLSAVCIGDEKTLCNAGSSISMTSHAQGFSLGLERIYDSSIGLMWVYIGGTYGYYSAFIWLPNEKIALALTVNATTQKSKKLLKTLGQVAKIIKENKGFFNLTD